MAKKTKIIVPRDGISTGEQPVRGLYDPLVDKVIGRLGKKETTRASHVEPTEELTAEAKDWVIRQNPDSGFYGDALQELYNATFPPSKWWADLLPVGGPVIGPLDTREEALAAEETWLHENHIPYCRPCADSQDSK